MVGPYNYQGQRKYLQIYSNSSGKLKKVGQTRELTPIRAWLYGSILNYSKFRLFMAYRGIHLSDSDITNFVAQLKELEISFSKKFPEGKFIVVTYPRYSQRYGERVKQLTTQLDISYVVLPKLENFKPVSMWDNHPSKETLGVMGRDLKNLLDK